MKQYVDCGTIEAAREFCKRIKRETGMTWHSGRDLAKDDEFIGYTTIGYKSNYNGIAHSFVEDSGARRVSPDYFILSLKIDQLKKERKALKAKEQQ